PRLPFSTLFRSCHALPSLEPQVSESSTSALLLLVRRKSRPIREPGPPSSGPPSAPRRRPGLSIPRHSACRQSPGKHVTRERQAMLRITSAVVIGLALACAFTLYTVSYDTRELDQLVQSKERRIERLRSDIAVLRAELAYLSRPERIEPLAR